MEIIFVNVENMDLGSNFHGAHNLYDTDNFQFVNASSPVIFSLLMPVVL